MKKISNIVLALLGLGFLFLGYIYFTASAGSLPHFMPGYEVGSEHIHFKHGLGSVILGVGIFIFVWFRSAPAPAVISKEELVN